MKHSTIIKCMFFLPTMFMLVICSSGSVKASGDNIDKISHDSVEVSEDNVTDSSLDILDTSDGIVTKSKLDSVVWYDNDGYFSAHLYICELDTTVYKGFSDSVAARMNEHINCQETLECIERAKRVFLKSFSALPKQEKTPLIHESKALLRITLERHGYVRRVDMVFYTPSKKHPPDEFIQHVDRKIRAIKFPPTTDFGINFNKIFIPIKNNVLLQCLE